MEADSSCNALSSNRVRGWNGLGPMSSTLSIWAPGPRSVGLSLAPGMRASSPRPRAFLCMVQDLLRELAIAFRTGAVRVVEGDGLAERGGFAQPHVSWDGSLVNPFRKELASFVRHLLGEVETGVEHGEEHAFDPKSRVQMVLDQ